MNPKEVYRNAKCPKHLSLQLIKLNDEELHAFINECHYIEMDFFKEYLSSYYSDLYHKIEKCKDSKRLNKYEERMSKLNHLLGEFA
jgi:hypothetical protein